MTLSTFVLNGSTQSERAEVLTLSVKQFVILVQHDILNRC